MAVCRATKANGERCTLSANGPHGFCWAHNPANREKRRRMASKAARAKPNRELPQIKALLEDLTERVLSGDLKTGPAAVANQLINTRLRAIEIERKVKEAEELEERMEALERILTEREAQSTMSRTNGVGKLYDRLTPEERFRLDVEAMARGDAEESELLTSTCPRHTYTMTDVGFSGRWDGAIQLTMATLMDLRQSTAKLRMVDAFRAVLPYAEQLAHNSAAEAYFEAREDDSSEAGVDEDLDRIEARIKEDGRFIPELLGRLERELATEGLAVWQAFSLFCEEEVGISPEKLLRATFPPALEDVGWFRQLCERLQLEAEEADVEEYHEYMQGHWRRRFGT